MVPWRQKIGVSAIEKKKTFGPIGDGARLEDVFLTLDEALEGFIWTTNAITSIDHHISIHTTSGSLTRHLREEVRSAIDSLGGSLSTLSSWYRHTSKTVNGQLMVDKNRTEIGLNMHSYGGNHGTLVVSGNDEHLTSGIFENISNLLAAEIDRKFPKSPPKGQKTSTDSSRKASLVEALNKPKNLWLRLWQSPVWSKVIATIIVAALTFFANHFFKFLPILFVTLFGINK